MKLAARYQNLRPSGMVRMFQAIEKMEGVLNLSIGEPDFDTEPDIIDTAAAAAHAGFTHYPPLQGFRDTQEAVCRYWERHHNLSSHPEEVYMAVGGVQVAHLALAALLEPGDEVLLLEPYFPPYAAQVVGNGGVPKPVPTKEENGFAPELEDMERVVSSRTKVLILNSPGNPSGRVMTRACLEEIANFVEKHDLFVLSDEIYEALVYQGKHIPFATLPGMRERTLTMGGLSKSHCMTGWRVGFGIGPEPLTRVMTLISSHQTYGLNTLAQKATTYALDSQDEKLDARRGIFGSRMKATADRLNAMKGVSCAAVEGAFYLFPNIKETGMSSEDFAWKLLESAHVAVLPGSAFGLSGEGHLRIACTQSEDTLMKAMDAMEAFVGGKK
ncbi:MAG: aminotransferase class I/II-fold pyridoxal phosphate-dependent enzyme [Fretibacterium sp.]|nr:aminotransferase class I/II-fold pyridoxal phosphate-dependent enzyme [Fretibacterium sp.]